MFDRLKRVAHFIRKLLLKPKETEKVSDIKIWILRFLRIFIFYIALYQMIFGEHGMGFMTLLVFLSITLPRIFTQGRVKNIPTEIEILLFIVVITQYVLGEIDDLYYTLPYYDKVVHSSASFILSIVAYVVIFSMQTYGKLQASRLVIIIIVILITLGIGAMWEIIEYWLDFLRVNYFTHWVTFQGSLVEGPYEDTMNDLVADFIAGLFGALIAWKYLLSNKGDMRLKEMLHEVNREFLE